ncbi:uncharacterized protein LOC133186101 [Saccostrea echinata]|uniref:uncharacterized protein LOC133186101 n=1 Tax=Saccostrea echinata TaxID=191078 RepID=UPI002A814B9F|nr:uncharacterized protein LOC133186101 [Saccostrea echinata]
MCDPHENNSAKIVHESVPLKDTQEPGELSGELKSISEIKENLFNATPTCSDGGAENLEAQSDHPSTHTTDLNLSSTSLGFSVHEPVENEDRGNNTIDPQKERTNLSRALSQSSGYSGSVESECHFHGENPAPHDALVMRQAFIQRTSSGSLSSSLTTEEMRRLYDKELYISGCDKCRLLRGTCPSKESIDFWDDVDMSGGDDKIKCHSKFWSYFIAKLKEKFPEESGLNSKQTVNLLKTLLNVQNTDDGEITLSNFVKIVRFFGPFKKDDKNCVIIHHMSDIVKRSLVKSARDKKKISWFAGDMTREDAEKILEKQKNNTYLVRMSQSGSEDGNFVVSVKDENGVHHFEIEGNPEASSKSASLNCNLKFLGKTYETLPGVIEDLKYHGLKDEGDEEEVQCTFICPDLPFNTVITPYKRA